MLVILVQGLELEDIQLLEQVGGGAGGGAGNYINGGGGYSGGSCENDRKYAQYTNGKAETILNEITAKDGRGSKPYSEFDWKRDSAGGGYLSEGILGPCVASMGDFGCHIGGEGAVLDAYGSYETIGVERGGLNGKTGSGGYAGSGGTIICSSECKVYAYNGNECSLDKDETDYYYKALEIDIQDGVCRDLYFSNNTLQENIDKLGEKLGIDTSNWSIAISSHTELVEHVIKDSDRTVQHVATSYGQGIGSGAGYIEVSNGTYTVDSSMN